MNDSLQPPAERDMPPGRAARMRADLLTEIHRPDRRHRRRRLVFAAAAVAAVGGASVPLMARNDDAGVEVLAMSATELSSPLHASLRQCLTWNTQHPADDRRPTAAVTMADLAVAAQRGEHAVAMFLTRTGYFTCEVSMRTGQEPSGGTGAGEWRHRDWLPGPVERVGLASTEVDGGTVLVTGRVSDRVHRLVLDHGDGHTTTARIQRGVFGLISRGGGVTGEAELISYDDSGTEIDRRPLFRRSDPAVPKTKASPPDGEGRCYVDPAGTVLYGRPGPDCRPAEPWRREPS